MTAPPLESAEARLLRIPLTRPWGPDVTKLGVVAVRVRDADGAVGHGFSWTPTIGARAVRAMLEEHLLPFALDHSPDPEESWDLAWEHVHEAGGGGVTTIALAGIDLALWDLRARRAGVGLPELLGRRHDRQPAYGSGVNLHYSRDELVAQVRRWVDAGFGAVKVKLGRSPEEDLDRMLAVREVLGPDRQLMVDANQRWDVDRALRGAEDLADVGIEWLEEPLCADDLAAHRVLRDRTEMPIAVGENLHTVHRFREVLDAGVADVVQPNVVRVGGITPFLRIAELAHTYGVRVAPHLLPEVSAQLAFALPAETWVEDVEGAGFAELGALAAPSGVQVEGGWALGGPTLGLGLEFTDTFTERTPR